LLQFLRREKEIMSGLICALLSAAMFYFGFGLDDVWWLAWLAPAPILWLAYGPAPRWQIILAALVAGAAGQAALVQAYWGTLPPALLVLMPAAVAALFAAAVMAARTLQRRLPPLAGLFAFPAIWTSLEYLNSLVSPNGSFGSVAYASVPFPASVQIASLLGLYAVSFLMCLFANALALLGRGARGPALVGLGLCVASLVFGYARLSVPQGATIQVAALSDGDAWRRSLKSLDMAASQKMAAEYKVAARAEADRGARFIVIPETAIAFDPAWRGQVTQSFRDLARDRGLTLVVGTMGVKPWRNVAMAFLPDGSVREYDKRHLLPPFELKYTPGSRAGLLGADQAVAICKDMDFERTLRSDAGQGVIRIMAVPANDFVKDDWMHARMAILRGVENGFAIVRSAFNGIETVSDAQGRVLASARTYAPGLTAIRASVPLGPGPTLYTRIGDVFAWGCLVLAVVLAGFGFRKRRE
jgi:apolipoprotein N-acyltransferase